VIRPAALLLVALTACQPIAEPPPPETGLPGYDPNLLERQSAACAARGGRWGQGGIAGTFVCYETPDDANAPCASETQCSTICLARSRSCAPVTPFFGCHEVLTASGGAATICID